MALASFSFWRCHSLGFPTAAAPLFRVSCSSLKLNTTLTEINKAGVIPCLRARLPTELALEAEGTALTGDISVDLQNFWYPYAQEKACWKKRWRLLCQPQVLQELVQNHPRKVIGVGTVLNAKDAKTAINAGAKFLMSPVIVKACSWNLELLFFLNMLNDHQEIMDDVQGGEVLYIPGAMTPTEIFSAYNAGAKIVKEKWCILNSSIC
ncbi:uncharacterized protein LOC104877879 isoform X1 [Vitis vinifera]|uniref:uncharacterized protein LOC104877879 isoform X1 n=1 Tax=Vitis vinifera TaxID=29760 RepID=UPI0008FEC89E|nr:uncharacterized protein LOC104877879 isoform X1 [Vitis vinifera]XP_059598027.1 uncharacterized protein LOC104877879 isoform X1 [Vitis vinifera]XP_059598028.1 uncharacterized protein LOC104877879 isoform X1 [Vitis vinifera]|eukprot:XP_019073253.1 PREDICTED: uncharacterized protein LOC104877879 isoform X2 [Vitis vinifera]